MEVSGALFNAVEAWAKELGLDEAHGPLGFTDLDKEGLLIEGFDRMGSTVTIYNYAYYPRHFEAHGYVKDIDWVEFRIRCPKKMIPASRVSAGLQRKSWSARMAFL